MMVVFKMHDSVSSARYSAICNVLRQWKTSLIPTYRVYRLYDILSTYGTFNMLTHHGVYIYIYIGYMYTTDTVYNYTAVCVGIFVFICG